jgi:CTP:molybdopterin cytidylyltransferase MocA
VSAAGDVAPDERREPKYDDMPLSTTDPGEVRIVGVLLAAGSGRRFGGPKSLADTGDGPWVGRALATLDDADNRIVVVGAAADTVTALLPAGVRVVANPDHASGMASSLRAGLGAVRVGAADAAAVVVMLVDLPDVPRAAVRRVMDLARRGGPAAARRMLARAVYRGTPGHPVLIGADHIAGVRDSAGGDRGARDYLARHSVIPVECGDLASGDDVDALPSGQHGKKADRHGNGV